MPDFRNLENKQATWRPPKMLFCGILGVCNFLANKPMKSMKKQGTKPANSPNKDEKNLDKII